MTETLIRNFVISIAKLFVGYNEWDGSHRKIIDRYNGVKPLPVGYAVSYYDAWCATFISAIGIMAELSEFIFRECSCPRMIDLYKKAGRWMERDSYVPKPGDIVMYDWDDSGVGDNVGTADHVGYVVSVNGNEMLIIEGNIGNAVNYRPLEVDGKYIRGYCLPDYVAAARKYEEENMTYEQFKVFMDQYMDDVSKQDPASWSKNSRNWAENAGLVKGDEKGQKRYKSNITREEFIEVLHRYDQQK